MKSILILAVAVVVALVVGGFLGSKFDVLENEQTGAIIGVVLVLLIKTFLTEKTRADYQKQLEDHKDSLLRANEQRKRVLEFIDFIDLWIHKEGWDDAKLKSWEVQKKYWSIALVLDEDIIRHLGGATKDGNLNLDKLKEGMLKVRHFVRAEPDKLNKDDLKWFMP